MTTVLTTVVRLRPIVHASPLPTGVHVRGWSSSFTVEGGPGVWTVWRALARHLAGGVPVDHLDTPTGRPDVVRVIGVIVAQLREHDMLVEVPVGWGEPGAAGSPDPDLAGWLESVAPDPVTAWRRLHGMPVTVAGTGPVADSARRTLTAAGLTVEAGPGPTNTLRATASGLAAAAACDDTVGFAGPVGPPADSDRTADAVAQRLGLRVVAPEAPPYPLAALVGAAVAHRLVCAVAGLPDPSVQAATLGSATDSLPAVLVARLDPLSATYHPWLPAASTVPSIGTGSPIDRALRALDALTDPELGPLPPAVLGDLPQLPVNLAVAGDALGAGVTADAARLSAVLAAAERALSGPVPAHGVVSVGTDHAHAVGVAMRRRAHTSLRRLATDPVDAGEWERDPTARRWWKTLTLRLAVPARMELRRLHADAVCARVLRDAEEIAWSVEACAADAAAFALVQAVAQVQVASLGDKSTLTARRHDVPCADSCALLTGAAPAWRPTPDDVTPWTDAHWHWPGDVGRAETRLQAALFDVVPGPLHGLPTDVHSGLTRDLAAVGFHAVGDPHGRGDAA